MIAFDLFALTASEMGLDPLTIIVIVIAASVFIAGFVKSSRENEYKKIMDSYVNKKEKRK